MDAATTLRVLQQSWTDAHARGSSGSLGVEQEGRGRRGGEVGAGGCVEKKGDAKNQTGMALRANGGVGAECSQYGRGRECEMVGMNSPARRIYTVLAWIRDAKILKPLDGILA